jgi:hypothetical protein
VAAVAAVIGMSLLPLGAAASHALTSTEPASTPPTYGYESYAGTSKYLAYGRFAVEATGRLASTGDLLVRTLHGNPREIATISRSLGSVSMAGSMLVHEELSAPDSTTTVTWTNLTTGAHGTFSTDASVTAAPNGWLTTDYSAEAPHAGTVYLHRATGGTTTLGTPHPDGTGFALTVGPSTVVADSPYDDVGNGTAEYVALNHPGTFHPLVPTSDGAVSAECDSVTSRFIACNTAGSTDTNAIYSVTGKLIIRTSRHCPQSVPAIDGASMAWVVQAGASCPSHELVIVSSQGKARIVAGPFGIGTPTSAFGKIVVGKHLVGGNRWFKEFVVVRSTGHQRTILG